MKKATHVLQELNPIAITGYQQPNPQVSSWAALRQLPYKLAAAGAFAIGCALLLLYLVSIEYVPTDLLSLLGLASLVSAWLLALWLLVTIAMFAPVVAVMLYGVKAPKFWLMLLGQVSGSAIALGSILHAQPYGPGLLVAGCVVAAASLAWLIADQPGLGFEKVALTLAAMLLGGAALPFGVLTVALTGGVREWPTAVWISACLALFGALLVINARAAAFKGHPLLSLTLSGIVAAVVSLTAIGWRPIPAILAERVGIRLAGTSTLIVTNQSCEVIAVAVSLHDTRTKDELIASCESKVPVVTAQIELRWSGQLLLTVEQLNGIQVPKGASRMTIPENGTQIVLRARRG